MNSDQEVHYKDFVLIAKCKDSAVRGRAWPSHARTIDGFESIRTSGDTTEEAIVILKKLVDTAIAQKSMRLRETLASRHDEYLRKRNIEPMGRKMLLESGIRTAKCHGCGDSLNNSENPSCLACRGIICLRCAACGCGFSPWNNRNKRIS